MDTVSFPNNVDDPAMLFIWSWDEILPFLTIFGFGVLLQQTILSIAIGVILTKIYIKLKEGKRAGFMFHMLYWKGIFPIKQMRTIPDAYQRRFTP